MGGGGNTALFINKQCMNFAAVMSFTEKDFRLECFFSFDCFLILRIFITLDKIAVWCRIYKCCI